MGGSQPAALLTLLKPSTVAAYVAAGFWGDETIYTMWPRGTRRLFRRHSRCPTAIVG
jgi:hypothetical protein